MIPMPQSVTADVSPRPSNHTAKRPFPTSPIKQIAALHRLATRLTLRNPGFFEPTRVISMPLPSIAILAKGMAPIKNAARNFRTTIIVLYGCAPFLWLRAIALAFAAAHLLYGCALSRLHSLPLIYFMAARYRACIRCRSSTLWLRAIALAFAAAHLLYGCALSRLHSLPLIYFMAARYRACIRCRSSTLWLRAIAL